MANDNELSPEEIASLVGTKVKNVSDLAPTGKYPVEIVDMAWYKPGQWDGEEVGSVLSYTLRNLDDENATPIRYRIKVYNRFDDDGNVTGNSLERATAKSKWGQLLAAVWMDEDERLGKGPDDLIGERCLALVSHQPNPSDPSKTYASVALRPLPVKK